MIKMLLDNNSIWACLCSGTHGKKKEAIETNRHMGSGNFQEHLLNLQTENKYKIDLKFLFHLKLENTAM